MTRHNRWTGSGSDPWSTPEANRWPRRWRMAGLVGAALAALFLGGCLSSAEITRINAEEDTSRCTAYGFKPGTEAFARCRFDLDRRRDEARTAMLTAPFPGPVYVGPPGPCWHTRWGWRCEPW